MAEYTNIPNYGIWGVLLLLVGALVAQALRASREKHNAQAFKIAEIQKRRKVLIAVVDGIIASLDGRRLTLPLWKDTLQDLKEAVGAYAEILKDRSGLDEIWHQYQSINPNLLKDESVLEKDGWNTTCRRGVALMLPLLEKLKRYEDGG